MGADARWVCHTCKTLCSRGGRPVPFAVGFDMSKQSIINLKKTYCTLGAVMEMDDQKRIVGFLDDLIVWLGVHEGHNIHVGSDYSTDMMDLEIYKKEAINGTTHKLTMIEEEEEARSKAEAKGIDTIKGLIEEYADNKDSMSSEAVAKVIIKRFPAFF